MTRFKAVLFDYDDTLANSFPARSAAARKSAELLSSDADKERLDRLMTEWAGRPQLEIFREIADDEAQAQALFDAYRARYWNETTNDVVLFPGVREMLSDLKHQGHTLGIVTSKARRLENEHGAYGATVELERLEVIEIFDLIVGWEDVQESKPSPAPILFALDKLQVDKDDAIMVGDSHIDIRAAKNAGIASAGATWGTVAKTLLVQAGPDFIVDSPLQLASVVS